MDLKRGMLLRLARQDPQLHPDDPARRAAIYDKYRVRVPPTCLLPEAPWPGPHASHSPLPLVQDFVIPEAEAEWVGLTLEEALEKQRLLEEKVSERLCSGQPQATEVECGGGGQGETSI